MNENERKNKEFAEMLEEAMVAKFQSMTPEEIQKVQSYMVNSNLPAIIKDMEKAIESRKNNTQPKG